MNTLEYFRSRVSFPISDSTIEGILFGRGFVREDRFQEMSERDRDLIYADTLLYGSMIMNRSSKRGSFSEAISNNVSKSLLDSANEIYKKYNDDKYDSSLEGTLKWVEYE